MAEQFETGDRVRVVQLRDGADMPADVVGQEGVIQWVTPGYAGERGYYEVKLTDGRVLQFQAKELEPA